MICSNQSFFRLAGNSGVAFHRDTMREIFCSHQNMQGYKAREVLPEQCGEIKRKFSYTVAETEY